MHLYVVGCTHLQVGQSSILGRIYTHLQVGCTHLQVGWSSIVGRIYTFVGQIYIVRIDMSWIGHRLYTFRRSDGHTLQVGWSQVIWSVFINCRSDISMVGLLVINCRSDVHSSSDVDYLQVRWSQLKLVGCRSMQNWKSNLPLNDHPTYKCVHPTLYKCVHPQQTRTREEHKIIWCILHE